MEHLDFQESSIVSEDPGHTQRDHLGV